MLDHGQELVEPLLVLAGVVNLSPGCLEQLRDVRLQGADRPDPVVDVRFEILNQLAGPVLVNRPRLSALLRFLADLLDGESRLGDGPFLMLELFLVARLATGQLAQCQAELIDLALERGYAGFFAPPVVILTICRDS
jgi:hypothetical protein